MSKNPDAVAETSCQPQQQRHAIWVLVVVMVVAFVLRMWRITNPVLDWHAFRQADTASVTREYVKHGIDLLHPKYHDLSNIQSGIDNLAGYRMVEFPIINAVVATLIRAVPILPIELTSRAFAVIASLLTAWLFYESLRLLLNRQIALASMIAFAVLPYAVYYGRVILPEPFLLLFAITTLWSFTQYHHQQKWFYLAVFTVSLSLALLLKPFIVFYAPLFIAIHVWWWVHQTNKKQASITSLWLVSAGLISLVPFWRWRVWIEQFPSGIPASDWLFNSNGIRWRPAWFRWLGYERLTKLILGFTGSVFFIANIFALKYTKLLVVLISWWLGMLAYLSVIATGNVQHDYYQVLLIPVVTLTLGSGAVAGFDWLSQYLDRRKALSCLALLAILSWWLAQQQIVGFFNVNHWEYVEAGKIVDQHTPTSARVIAPAFGDTMFLYQTNRIGWPIGFEIEKKIELGATHYITTSYDDEARELEKNYTTVVKTNQYLLLDLTKPTTTHTPQITP